MNQNWAYFRYCCLNNLFLVFAFAWGYNEYEALFKLQIKLCFRHLHNSCNHVHAAGITEMLYWSFPFIIT